MNVAPTRIHYEFKLPVRRTGCNECSPYAHTLTRLRSPFAHTYRLHAHTTSTESPCILLSAHSPYAHTYRVHIAPTHTSRVHHTEFTASRSRIHTECTTPSSPRHGVAYIPSSPRKPLRAYIPQFVRCSSFRRRLQNRCTCARIH